ncbi:MAG TPA: DUF6285 domain-containing protein [Solirubrobacteraceae bacterium]|nr:DUF6285 domain-containing protein [Solirubrobacteraceae bacterium]
MSHGIPTTSELVAAVREFLQAELLPATEGRLQFHTRVAANVLAQVERELELGAPSDPRTDAELCAAVRNGEDVYEAVRASVVRKLRISNPRHLLPEDR